MPGSPAYPPNTPPGNAGRDLKGCYDFEIPLQKVCRKPDFPRGEGLFRDTKCVTGEVIHEKMPKETESKLLDSVNSYFPQFVVVL